MILETERLILRRWEDTDAESLYEYAKDPDVGPIAGWAPHKNVAESLNIIKNVLNGSECYAICERGNNKAIGSIELRLNGCTDMTDKDDECELGYWLGKPFWGRGYMPEAATELLRHGFETLGMNIIWCGYYDGNNKSKRVQEKLGFSYHHTCEEVEVPLMNEIRIGHTNYMTKEMWKTLASKLSHEKSELRPFVICHMVTSIDSKVTGDFLYSKKGTEVSETYYEINRRLKGDA